jgi:hypothetical protein
MVKACSGVTASLLPNSKPSNAPNSQPPTRGRASAASGPTIPIRSQNAMAAFASPRAADLAFVVDIFVMGAWIASDVSRRCFCP